MGTALCPLNAPPLPLFLEPGAVGPACPPPGAASAPPPPQVSASGTGPAPGAGAEHTGLCVRPALLPTCTWKRKVHSSESKMAGGGGGGGQWLSK